MGASDECSTVFGSIVCFLDFLKNTCVLCVGFMPVALCVYVCVRSIFMSFGIGAEMNVHFDPSP
jgi:hypothetical protein